MTIKLIFAVFTLKQVDADCDGADDDGSLYDLFPEARPWIPITETNA